MDLSECMEMTWQNENSNVEALGRERRKKGNQKEAKSRELPKYF